MNVLTAFYLNPISGLSANVQKLIHRSQARKSREINETQPISNRDFRGIIMNVSTEWYINSMSGLFGKASKLLDQSEAKNGPNSAERDQTLYWSVEYHDMRIRLV